MPEPTDAEVERVARAIHQGTNAWRHGNRYTTFPPWGAMGEVTQESFRVAARAAIKALQKPTRRKGAARAAD